MKLYSIFQHAGYAKIATLTLAEKQVLYEFVHVDGAGGEHKSEEFLKKQPFGNVPVLVSTTSATRARC
jgi:glutathione S-transferase